MQLFFNNEPVDEGKHHCTVIETHLDVTKLQLQPYRISVERDMFVDRVNPVFDRFQEEMKANLSQYNEVFYPDLYQMAEAGWPDLPTYMDQKPSRCGQVLTKWCTREVIASLFPLNERKDGQQSYQLGPINRIGFTDDKVVIQGHGFLLP